MKNVVIVGAGFGGLKAAKILGRQKDINLTVIDRRNHHLFQPLLYQVAMAGLSPADIATPIRSVLRGANTKVILGNVTHVDLAEKRLQCDADTMSFDFLILACGAKHSYFGHSEWEEFAPGLKTLEQATEIRRRVLLAFEMAEREPKPEIRRFFQTFVIVGAGPTGVELAGSIAEISRYTLEKDFRTIDPSNVRIILIEADPRILAQFSEDLSKRAHHDLENLGVQIWTSSRVTKITADCVELGSETLRAKTVLWAAGVQPSSLNKTLGVPLDSAGRVYIENDLSLAGHPDTFVVGDQAHFRTDKGPLPGLAPVAMQQGIHAAQMILASVRGKPRKPFKYLDKGMMATIGRNKAVAQVGDIHFGGVLAWLAWLFIHIYYLIGFRNRLFVFLEWFWSYLTYQRGARLIVGKEWRTEKVDRTLDGSP